MTRRKGTLTAKEMRKAVQTLRDNDTRWLPITRKTLDRVITALEADCDSCDHCGNCETSRKLRSAWARGIVALLPATGQNPEKKTPG